VPGTQRPANWADISKLNPCPLNACCDVWSQCGTTAEFCTPTPADTGAPGTAQPGTNGCISNCGTGIVNNSEKPASFSRVGYFEAWNADRPCLNMEISQFDAGAYSHVHFAFATITPDFKVNISGVQAQFDKMKTLDMKGTKKILSFGGWSFSTSYDSFPIFRNSVTAANRGTFATNVVQFLRDNNLDGLDFDWEYPGAIDVPHVASGDSEEGSNYLEFLKIVQACYPQARRSPSPSRPASGISGAFRSSRWPR
jgi:chitinase